MLRAILRCTSRLRLAKGLEEEDELDSPPLSFTTLGGGPLTLDPPARSCNSVEHVRQRLASALGVYFARVKLIDASARELHNGSKVREALGNVTAEASITVIVLPKPCEADPPEYEAHINLGAVAVLENDHINLPFGYPMDQITENGKQRTVPRHVPVEPVKFPPPRDININMMPFLMGQEDSIPQEYRQYWPLINKCNVPRHEYGKVAYLTVQESLVRAGETQRRGGLHVESPGTMRQGSYNEDRINWGCGIVRFDRSEVRGGIFMASNTPTSCRVWNVQVGTPLIGELGDVEHIRHLLGKGTLMEAGKIYWLTDVTPHESLALPKETYRQFIRVVTSSLSAWYPEHSTTNPLGIAPDPAVTKIITGSKFA